MYKVDYTDLWRLMCIAANSGITPAMYSSWTSSIWVEIWPQKQSQSTKFSGGACLNTPLTCVLTHAPSLMPPPISSTLPLRAPVDNWCFEIIGKAIHKRKKNSPWSITFYPMHLINRRLRIINRWRLRGSHGWRLIVVANYIGMQDKPRKVVR